MMIDEPAATPTRSSGSASARACVLLLIAPVDARPGAGRDAGDRAAQGAAVGRAASRRGEVLRSPVFWLLYVMLVGGVGERPDGDRADRADRQGLRPRQADRCCCGASVLSVALIVDSVMNGMARPFFGWVSDQIGRENTMAIAFTPGRRWPTCRSATSAASPWAFVLCAGADLLHLGRDLQPVPVDLHRPVRQQVRHHQHQACSTRPRARRRCWCRSPTSRRPSTGSWHAVFMTAAVVNFAVVLAALFILKPARRKG